MSQHIVSGPKYRDPNKLIPRRRDMDELDQILSGRSRQVRRDELVDRMVADFTAYGDQDNYILESDFKEYYPLFSNELREKVINRTISREELDLITMLSEKFYKNYNVQKPTHIVDRAGNEVMPPIPPILRRLNCMSSKLLDIVDKFHTAHAMDDGNIGGVADVKKKVAIVELLEGLRMSQFHESEVRDTLQFKQQADALNRVLFKDKIAAAEEVVAKTEKKEEGPLAPKPTSVNEYEMAYGPVDE